MIKSIRFVVLLTIVCLALPGASSGEYLKRERISLPEDVKAIFLAQMLGHMVALDGIVSALGRGQYGIAADIAATEMGGPRLSDTGGKEGPGLGIGKHMPPKFRAISGDFKKAANDFAALARGMPKAPSGDQQRALVAELGQITKQCRICHDTFQVD